MPADPLGDVGARAAGAAESVLGAEAARVAAGAAATLLECDAEAVRLGEPQKLSGGASRLTYLLEAEDTQPGTALSEAAQSDTTQSDTAQSDAGTRLIVQMERAGSRGANLPMSSQVELLRSAMDLGVPVPRVLGAGDSDGSGFVVLEWLEGEAVVRRLMRDDSLAELRGDLARSAGLALAAVHRIDPVSHPELPRHDPLEQIRGLLDMLGEPHPAFEVGLCWLEAHRPPAVATTVTHGDFRMGNLLVSPAGITAVLDWELAHIGSPAEDLGWFCCRAWRFGSPLRAGGVGTVEQLLAGYAEGGGLAPSHDELDWWEAYGTLRWGLICVLQASVHLRGLHRSVELAAIGRRACECEEDLLEIITGASEYEPPGSARLSPETRAGLHDRPDAAELLEAVGESLDSLVERLHGSASFEARVSANVVAMVRREVLLDSELSQRHDARMASLAVSDVAELASIIRSQVFHELDAEVISAVRADVRDKLAVSNPGYWYGDG